MLWEDQEENGREEEEWMPNVELTVDNCDKKRSVSSGRRIKMGEIKYVRRLKAKVNAYVSATSESVECCGSAIV